MRTDQFNNVPIEDLLDYGYDRETGSTVIRLKFAIRFFGRTLSGDPSSRRRPTSRRDRPVKDAGERNHEHPRPFPQRPARRRLAAVGCSSDDPKSPTAPPTTPVPPVTPVTYAVTCRLEVGAHGRDQRLANVTVTAAPPTTAPRRPT